MKKNHGIKNVTVVNDVQSSYVVTNTAKFLATQMVQCLLEFNCKQGTAKKTAGSSKLSVKDPFLKGYNYGVEVNKEKFD